MKPHISFRETVKTLLRHRKVADQRAFGTYENRVAKFMVYLSMSLIVIYLIAMAIPFAMIANESTTSTASEILCDILPFILAIDFAMRFLVQQTPAQIARPYMMLPLSRYACIDTFIWSSIMTWGNLTWLLFVLPYVLMAVVFSYGLLTTAIIVTLVVVLVAANSQWYSIARTLINDSYVWWLLPAAVYAAIGSPLYIGSDAGLDQFDTVYSTIGTAIDSHSPLPLLIATAIFAALIAINRRLQYKYVMRELMRSDKAEVVKHVNRFTFLERYGELGTFLQLEIKLLTRNKNPRKTFFVGIGTVSLLCAIIVTSDVYDSTTMTNYWAIYCFILLSSNMIVRAMSYEGNYLDCLLVRRENILALLHAKYICYSLLLILPMLLMLPTVISGKWSLLMLISYALFTMGFQYFIMFQGAIYNKQTIPLNEKITGKGGLEGNYVQMLIMIAVFILPNVITNILQKYFGDNEAYAIMTAIGLAFIFTHKIWLRNIYNRMMKRKYDNLQSFTATR